MIKFKEIDEKFKEIHEKIETTKERMQNLLIDLKLK